METAELGIINPAGLSFSMKTNTFYVLPRGKKVRSSRADIFRLTPTEDLVGYVSIKTQINDPINMAFDNKADRLLIFNSVTKKLVEVAVGADGNLKPSTLTYHKADHFGVMNPQGITVDPKSGHLFILDADGPRLVRVEPAPDKGFDNALVLQVALPLTVRDNLRGLAFDSTTGHFHVMNPNDQMLYEFTESGQLVATRDVSAFDLYNPQGMVFAPSGDLTDDPSELSLYISDSGLRSPGAKASNLAKNGQIMELSLIEPMASTLSRGIETLSSMDQGYLVQVIDTSQFSPPSPDPSGVAYLPDTGTLLISDAEVNEMSIFTGSNLFEMTLTGNLLDTFTTTSFSDEPNGADYDPVHGRFFFSDDTGTRSIYEVAFGPDGLFGTSDDIVTSFATGAFGSSDPEGVAYDSWQNVLFIADGLNSEVYRVSPGGNGIFDGVPPAGDDVVTSFDTEVLGLLDPEGISFNTDNGHLHIIGEPTNLLYEVTTTGALVRKIDISVTNAKKPAGLAYAPSSINPSEMNIYMVARGVDNDSDPNENDGKVYEISFSQINPGNTPPTVDAGPDQFVSLPDSATLDGTVTDDGLPNPPGLVSVNWSQVAGPGMVIFADANVVDTTASFSVAGIYILRLTADDGELQASDTVTVSVNINSVDDPPTVDAGPDQFVSLPDSAILDGTVTDDGLPDPPGAVIVNWSQVDGPGMVIFADANVVDTTASFSVAGIYILRLTADDGELQASDDVTVVVTGDNGTEVVDVRIAASSDDAEEKVTGGMRMTSSDLDLVYDKGDQTVGMRFNGVDIPREATVLNAYVQFRTDQTNSELTSLTIKGEAVDNAVTFSDIKYNISSRPTTLTGVSWSPDPWLIVGEAGVAQQTPDISSIIQEIVNRPGWTIGNSLAIIITGTGLRTAEAFEGDAAGAPLLHVEYSIGSPNNPPVANDDTASTTADTLVTIDVSVNDNDPDGNLDRTSANTECSSCSVPSNGTLFNNGDGSFDYTPDPGFTGTDGFVYEICDTESACDTAQVSITVTGGAAPVITLLGANPLLIEFGALHRSGCPATDDVDGDLTGSIVVGGDPVTTSALGSYTVTYNVRTLPATQPT